MQNGENVDSYCIHFQSTSLINSPNFLEKFFFFLLRQRGKNVFTSTMILNIVSREAIYNNLSFLWFLVDEIHGHARKIVAETRKIQLF